MRRLQSTWFTGVSTAAVVFACAVAHTGTAVAAEADAANATGIEELVVTGRKRAKAELLQQTPISASAVSPKELDSAHAVTLLDVGRMLPGVTFQQGTSKGFNNFAIRGMGQSGTSPQDEAPVGIIADGVYWASPLGSVSELFDLEAVEVLRGPQGTLFGRNVTGGAVVVTTASPTFSRSVSAMAGYGKYNSAEASLVLNGPVLGDMVAARLSMSYKSTDGAFRNSFTNSQLGAEETGIVRLGVRITPNDDVDILLKGEWFELDGDAQPSRGISPSTVPASVTNPVPANSLPFLDGYRTPADFWTIASGDLNFVNDQIYNASAQLTWKVAGGVLTWINGYRHIKDRGSNDFDGAPGIYFNSSGDYDQEQQSSELRFAQTLGRVDYTVGGYYIRSNFMTAQTRALTRNTTRLATQSYQQLESIALFGEADITITPALTATVGVRYTEEDKVASVRPFGACDFNRAKLLGEFVCAPTTNRTYSDNNFSPKFGLAYKISDRNLVFASVTRGYRSGGYALRGTALVSPYKAETVTAYELSSKNQFFDNRLRLNASVYLNKYQDLQRTTIATDPAAGIIQSTFNAADAEIKGIELEAVAVLTPNLVVSANYARTDASYSSFVGIVPFVPLKDLKFVRVPDDLFNFGVTYTRPVGDVGTLEGKLGVSYTSSFFYDDVNTPTNGQGGHTIVDSSLTLTSLEKDWSISLWGKNLTNTKYAQFGSTLGALGQNKFLAPPATYGVRLTRDF